MTEEYLPGVVGRLEMEVNKGRGVLYLNKAGTTIFRMCRIPTEILEELPARAKGVLLVPHEDSSEIEVVTEGGMLYLSIRGVPESIFSAIRGGSFADITMGYHPVTVESGFIK